MESKNAPVVRNILQQSQVVIAVFQGHNHIWDYRSIYSIHYFSLLALVEGAGLENKAYSTLSLHRDRRIVLEGEGANSPFRNFITVDPISQRLTTWKRSNLKQSHHKLLSQSEEKLRNYQWPDTYANFCLLLQLASILPVWPMHRSTTKTILAKIQLPNTRVRGSPNGQWSKASCKRANQMTLSTFWP